MTNSGSNLSLTLISVTALVIIVSLITNALLTPVVIRLARHKKWYDVPSSRKLHKGLIPRIGGLSIFISMVIGITVGMVALWFLEFFIIENPGPLIAAAGGVTAIFIVGLVDDLAPLNARTKILFQLGAATIIASSGIRIDSFSLPLFGSISLGISAIPLTVFWIVGMVNSVNLIDGRDGLAGGIAAFAALGLGIIALVQGNLLTVIVAVSLLGTVCGFLLHNWPPASIFMGDSGSHLIGFTLAIIPLLDIENPTNILTIVVPATLLLIPIVDCGAAVIRRIRQRVSLGTADTNHIHFILRDLGLSDRKILLVVYSTCIYLTGVSICIALRPQTAIYLSSIAWTTLLLTYCILVMIHTRRPKKN